MSEEECKNDQQYFKSYEDLNVHALMLRDEPRVSSYHDAIMNNAELFKDKIVMDVGAGTGILSMFCAKAGAKHVYAVEAASDLCDLMKELVADNKLSETITVVKGEVENIQNLTNLTPASVDIIVSEWMGFFLLHEGMLESVISARRFLKEDGIMFPDKCIIQAALCELPEFHDFSNFYGLNMSNFGKHLRACSQTEPKIRYVKEESILSKPIDLYSFDTKSVTEKELQCLSGKFVIPASREGEFQGLCIWFNVSFPSKTEDDRIVLSTSPFSKETHWKQTVIVFEEAISLEEDQPVGFELILKKTGSRFYTIEFSHAEESSIPHPHPCDCYEIKCKVIKAFCAQKSDYPLDS